MNTKLLPVAVLLAACSSATAPANTVTDSCAVVRPAFTPASAAERATFAYASGSVNVTKVVESTLNDIETSRIEFNSPGGGRATGLMFVPVTRSSLRPGVILQHGMPGNARSVANRAQTLAEHGAVVIALDAPFARRTGSPMRLITADSTEQVQLIRELQRAVDILRQQVNVDPDRIAYHGISYGGAMGALFVGVERRLATAILTVGDGGLVSHFTGSDDQPSPLEQVSCTQRIKWLKAMTPIEPIRFVGLAAPLPILLQSGRVDELVPVADAEALQQATSQPKTITWYDAGHALNQAATREQLEWLHRYIGLDAPL